MRIPTTKVAEFIAINERGRFDSNSWGGIVQGAGAAISSTDDQTIKIYEWAPDDFLPETGYVHVATLSIEMMV